MNVQLIGWKGGVGVSNRHAAQDLQVLCDAQLSAEDVGMPGHRNFHTGAQAAFGQGQQQRLKVHADAQGVWRAEVTVHADDTNERRAEEVKVAQHRRRPAGVVLLCNAHPLAVDFEAELGAEVGKLLGQRRDMGRFALGHVDDRLCEAVASCAGGEHHPLRLDVRVGRRELGQG